MSSLQEIGVTYDVRAGVGCAGTKQRRLLLPIPGPQRGPVAICTGIGLALRQLILTTFFSTLLNAKIITPRTIVHSIMDAKTY